MIKEFHPSLLPQIRELSIKANRKFLARTLTGNWLSSLKGRGMEFSDYRAYTSGDDASLIDWKASLRARKILVKELTEERNLNVYILLDVSNSMLYGSGELLKAEFAAEVVSSLSFAALHAGDAVALAMCADTMKHYLRPSIGMRQHSILLNLIANGDNWGGKFDFGAVMNQLVSVTRGRGVIIIVSDFLGMEDRWRGYLESASGRFQMIGVCIRDPRDRRLPKHAGEYVLEDPYSDEKIVIDCAVYAEPYRRYVEDEEERIRSAFRQVRGDVIFLEVGTDFVRPLMRFFHKRELRVEN